LPKTDASERTASICFGPRGCQRARRRLRAPLADLKVNNTR